MPLANVKQERLSWGFRRTQTHTDNTVTGKRDPKKTKINWLHHPGGFWEEQPHLPARFFTPSVTKWPPTQHTIRFLFISAYVNGRALFVIRFVSVDGDYFRSCAEMLVCARTVFVILTFLSSTHVRTLLQTEDHSHSQGSTESLFR